VKLIKVHARALIQWKKIKPQ